MPFRIWRSNSVIAVPPSRSSPHRRPERDFLQPASEPEIREARMVVRAAAQRPAIPPLALADRQVVDARDAQPHQPLRVELPVLVAVAAEPVPAVVVPLVREAHGDAVLAEGPQLLDQPVVELAVPLAPQEGLDRLAPGQELGAVPPAAVDGVGERHAGGVAGVPGVLSEADLLRRGLEREWRERGAGQGTSKRSRFITLSHAATKSRTKTCFASSQA